MTTKKQITALALTILAGMLSCTFAAGDNTPLRNKTEQGNANTKYQIGRWYVTRESSNIWPY